MQHWSVYAISSITSILDADDAINGSMLFTFWLILLVKITAEKYCDDTSSVSTTGILSLYGHKNCYFVLYLSIGSIFSFFSHKVCVWVYDRETDIILTAKGSRPCLHKRRAVKTTRRGGWLVPAVRWLHEIQSSSDLINCFSLSATLN